MPAKTASKKAPSSPKDFKKKKGTATLLELPSGAFMKCKRVELTSFLKTGNIPNALLKIVNDALKSGEEIDLENLSDDSGNVDIEMVKDMYTMMDQIVIDIALEPEVLPVPDNEADRSDEQLYVDELEDQDKFFLFRWSSGGTADLETFREESSGGLAAMEEVGGNKSKA